MKFTRVFLGLVLKVEIVLSLTGKTFDDTLVEHEKMLPDNSFVNDPQGTIVSLTSTNETYLTDHLGYFTELRNPESGPSKLWLRDSRDSMRIIAESNRDRDGRKRRHEASEANTWNRQLRRDERRKPPYSSTVRLSIGCTGTLLTSRHVLTAAHCLHNGSHLLINVQNFRVEIPSHSGRAIEYTASEIRLPRKWANDETYSRFRAMYDFAIITLSQETSSYWVPPTITVTDAGPLDDLQNDLIQFAGFPTGVTTAMWRKVCSFRGARYIHEGNVLHLKRCTASPGYSGAGVFKVAKRNRSQLIGVVSHLIQQTRNGQKVRYIVVSSFTESKKLLLCHMMNTDSADTCETCDTCDTLESFPRPSVLPYLMFDISNSG